MSISLAADHIVRDPNGLCSVRYHADIETHDVDYAALSVGDVVTVGDHDYEITRVGKRCHPECILVQAGRICQLKNNCAFAEPVAGATLNAGKKPST